MDSYDALDPRLAAKVRVTGSCWLWTGGCNRGGYPIMRVGAQVHYVQRWVFAATYGPIPPVLRVVHTCGQRRCLRPTHLVLLTPAELARQGSTDSPTAGYQHAANPGTKLSWDDVVAIRAAVAAGAVTQAELARRYGVSRTTNSHIVRQQTWRATWRDRSPALRQPSPSGVSR